MDRLKQYIESAQERTTQEKHSIALVIASAVSGALFVFWLGIALYNLSDTTVEEPVRPAINNKQPDASPVDVIEVQEVLSPTPEGGLQQPTYVDLDAVPAIYRPDSEGSTSIERLPTSTIEDSPAQGSGVPTSVIE